MDRLPANILNDIIDYKKFITKENIFSIKNTELIGIGKSNEPVLTISRKFHNSDLYLKYQLINTSGLNTPMKISVYGNDSNNSEIISEYFTNSNFNSLNIDKKFVTVKKIEFYIDNLQFSNRRNIEFIFFPLIEINSYKVTNSYHPISSPLSFVISAKSGPLNFPKDNIKSNNKYDFFSMPNHIPEYIVFDIPRESKKSFNVYAGELIDNILSEKIYTIDSNNTAIKLNTENIKYIKIQKTDFSINIFNTKSDNFLIAYKNSNCCDYIKSSQHSYIPFSFNNLSNYLSYDKFTLVNVVDVINIKLLSNYKDIISGGKLINVNIPLNNYEGGFYLNLDNEYSNIVFKNKFFEPLNPEEKDQKLNNFFFNIEFIILILMALFIIFFRGFFSNLLKNKVITISILFISSTFASFISLFYGYINSSYVFTVFSLIIFILIIIFKYV